MEITREIRTGDEGVILFSLHELHKSRDAHEVAQENR